VYRASERRPLSIAKVIPRGGRGEIKLYGRLDAPGKHRAGGLGGIRPRYLHGRGGRASPYPGKNGARRVYGTWRSRPISDFRFRQALKFGHCPPPGASYPQSIFADDIATVIL